MVDFVVGLLFPYSNAEILLLSVPELSRLPLFFSPNTTDVLFIEFDLGSEKMDNSIGFERTLLVCFIIGCTGK